MPVTRRSLCLKSMPVKDSERFFLGIAWAYPTLCVVEAIQPGDKVLAQSAYGDWLTRRATSTAVPGHDFAVVWVCPEDEWEAAQREGRNPDVDPWPAESVKPFASVG